MKEVHNQSAEMNGGIAGAEENDELSISALPSRKEIHGKKKQKTKWKIRFPFVKILTLFFILVLGTIWAVATQMTKDDSTTASSGGKDSEYTESIGEISGFDDEEDAEEEADKAAESEEVEQSADEQAEVEAEQPVEQEAVEVSTTENTEAATVETTEGKTESNVTTTEDNKNTMVEHVVQANENLYRIALKYYPAGNGLEIIKQYNGLKDNNIVVGQVLKIPPR